MALSPLLLQPIENFLVNQGASLVKSVGASLLTMLFAKFSFLKTVVSMDQAVSWEMLAYAAAAGAIIHLFDHNYNNANVAATDPNAPAPAASQPIPSAMPSASPSAQPVK